MEEPHNPIEAGVERVSELWYGIVCLAGLPGKGSSRTMARDIGNPENLLPPDLVRLLFEKKVGTVDNRLGYALLLSGKDVSGAGKVEVVEVKIIEQGIISLKRKRRPPTPSLRYRGGQPSPHTPPSTISW